MAGGSYTIRDGNQTESATGGTPLGSETRFEKFKQGWLKFDGSFLMHLRQGYVRFSRHDLPVLLDPVPEKVPYFGQSGIPLFEFLIFVIVVLIIMAGLSAGGYYLGAHLLEEGEPEVIYKDGLVEG
jgi:hypothetical protein